MVLFVSPGRSLSGNGKREAADGVGGLRGKEDRNVVRNAAYGAGAMRVRPSKL